MHDADLPAMCRCSSSTCVCSLRHCRLYRRGACKMAWDSLSPARGFALEAHPRRCSNAPSCLLGGSRAHPQTDRNLIMRHPHQQHPGGDEVLFGEAGRDATEAFEDVGHSDEAREILEKYLVGTCTEVSPLSLQCSAVPEPRLRQPRRSQKASPARPVLGPPCTAVAAAAASRDFSRQTHRPD